VLLTHQFGGKSRLIFPLPFDNVELIDAYCYGHELLVRFTQFHVPLILDEYLTAYRVHPNTKTHMQILKGYAESDRTRSKYLNDRKLASIYRRRSADNWLSLSESDRLELLERFTCILRAIRNQPMIIASHGCLSSVRKLVLDFLRVTAS